MIHVHVDQGKSTNNVMVNDNKVDQIVIVGTGKLAKSFLSYLKSIEYPVRGIWGRNSNKSYELSELFGVRQILSLNEIKNDWVIVCISDDAIDSVIQKLQEVSKVSVSSGVYDINKFKNTSLFYPLQSFDEKNDHNFIDIPIIIDGNENDLKFLKEFCANSKLYCYEMNLEKREQLHLVAVFFNNFTHHIMHRGSQLANQFKLDKDIFKSLIYNTFKRLDLNNMFKLQTGPAIREDNTTLEKHKKQLSGDFLKLYNSISESIINNKHELQGKTK